MTTDYIEEAKEFYEEAVEEFGKGYKENVKSRMRDACEKGWGAVVQATNALFVKMGIRALPKKQKKKNAEEWCDRNNQMTPPIREEKKEMNGKFLYRKERIKK